MSDQRGIKLNLLRRSALALCQKRFERMTLTEALPMMKNGLSLHQLQKIAEKQRTTAQML